MSLEVDSAHPCPCPGLSTPTLTAQFV